MPGKLSGLYALHSAVQLSTALKTLTRQASVAVLFCGSCADKQTLAQTLCATFANDDELSENQCVRVPQPLCQVSSLPVDGTSLSGVGRGS